MSKKSELELKHLARIRAVYNSYNSNDPWVTASWNHDLVVDGVVMKDERGPVGCYGFDDNSMSEPCDVCQEAESAAHVSRTAARRAVRKASEGEWLEAIDLSRAARDVESTYEEHLFYPCWRDLHKYIKTAYAEIQEEKAEEAAQ